LCQRRTGILDCQNGKRRKQIFKGFRAWHVVAYPAVGPGDQDAIKPDFENGMLLLLRMEMRFRSGLPCPARVPGDCGAPGFEVKQGQQ
jgi:hypothetical protein